MGIVRILFMVITSCCDPSRDGQEWCQGCNKYGFCNDERDIDET
jgi:hypothetical protein